MDDRTTHIKNQNFQSDLLEEVLHLSAIARNDLKQTGLEAVRFVDYIFTHSTSKLFHTDRRVRVFNAGSVGNKNCPQHRLP